MVKVNKEKIVSLSKIASSFFKSYLAEIVFIVFLLQLLISLNALPYFNIINKYYYYVAAILWVILNILFKKYITNKKILFVGVSAFFYTVPFAIFDINVVSDILGFLAFLMLFTYVVREIFTQKRLLRD